MKRILIFTFLVQLMFPLHFKIYGQISTNGSQVKNVGEPTEANDATTKVYVDALIENLQNQINSLNEPPSITLLGDQEICIETGSTYVDGGATAFDDMDGDITSTIVVTNEVNTSTPGEYKVTYNVTDSNGKYAYPVFRYVHVVSPYICNVSESDAVKGNPYVDSVKNCILDENAEMLFLAVSIEADINELDSFEERKMFLNDIGLNEPGSSKLIRSTYSLLNLQTFFTAGEKEVRAWTIPVGSTAPKAAGVIHTDFEKGFIRAEVISIEDLVRLGSELKVKEAGKVRVEGKDYVLKEGDVLHFRFNV